MSPRLKRKDPGKGKQYSFMPARHVKDTHVQMKVVQERKKTSFFFLFLYHMHEASFILNNAVISKRTMIL